MEAFQDKPENKLEEHLKKHVKITSLKKLFKYLISYCVF